MFSENFNHSDGEELATNFCEVSALPSATLSITIFQQNNIMSVDLGNLFFIIMAVLGLLIVALVLYFFLFIAWPPELGGGIWGEKMKKVSYSLLTTLMMVEWMKQMIYLSLMWNFDVEFSNEGVGVSTNSSKEHASFFYMK